MHPTLACSRSAVIGTLHDPLALVLRQGAQERDETAPDGRDEVQVGLVEDLDHGTPCVTRRIQVFPIRGDGGATCRPRLTASVGLPVLVSQSVGSSSRHITPSGAKTRSTMPPNS